MEYNGIQGPQGYQGASLQMKPNSGACTVPYSHMYLESNGNLMLYTGLGNSCFINIGNIKGPQGNIGKQGYQGYQGYRGFQGFQGVPGSGGASGVQGYQGNIGPQGYQGRNGNQGYQGANGSQGHQGYQGVGIRILGRVENYNELPQLNNEIGDGYILNGHLFVWNGHDWIDCGPIVGPQGEQGYQGYQGNQGYQGRNGVQGYQGNIGPQGYQGEIGHGINVKGTVENFELLYEIEDPEIGDAWITEDTGHLFVYNGTIWVDCGPIVGPQGDQGPQGETGPQGSGGGAFTTQDILVIGGPLADDSEDNWPDDEEWWNSNNERIIPSGKSLDEVLVALFTKEIWPTNVHINYPWGNVTSNPTVSTFTIDSGNECETDKSITSPIEIGTEVTFGGATASTPQYTYNVSSVGLVGFKYKKNDIESTLEYNGEYTKPYTATTSGNKALTIAKTGFTNSTITTAYTDTIPQITKLIVSAGDNKFKISQNGPIYHPQSNGEDCILYYSSNMNNYSPSKNVPVEYTSNYDGRTTTSTGNKTTSNIKGYRKYFYGGYELATTTNLTNWINNLNSDKIRKSISQGGLGLIHSDNAATNDLTFNYSVEEDVYNVLVVAVESSYTITIFDNNQNHNIYESDGVVEKFISIKANNDRYATNYRVWVFTMNNLNNFIANTFKITFNNQ